MFGRKAIYTRSLSRINYFYFYQVSLGSVQDYTSPQVHSFDPGSNCECNSSSPWESALRTLSICTPPPLGEAEGSRRVPWGKWLGPGTCRFPGTVHTDPLGGDEQALCGCSAQLVCAEITRDGVALLGSGRHLPAILPARGGVRRPCWPAFRTLRAPAQTLVPGLASGGSEDREQRHTHSPAYWVGGGASSHAHSPAAAPPPRPHPGMDQGEGHSVYRKRNGVLKVSKSLFTYSFPAVMFSH